MSGVCAVYLNDTAMRAADALTGSVQSLSVSAEPVKTAANHNIGVGVAVRFSSQQLYSDSDIDVVCDADLYNEQELWAALADAPERVGATERTAALFAAQYRKFGTGFVAKLRGGFSVIICDRRQQRLIAAVDGFGIKRLAYYQGAKGLVVASRIDGLLGSGAVPPEIRPQAIPAILNFSVNQGLQTIVKGVRRLPPGMLLIASAKDVHLERYWDMRYGCGETSNEESLCRELEAVLEESVRAHCSGVSAKERGAFLSGGTDSSTVVGLMTRIGGAPVEAFSIGFREHPFNELEYAEIAAKRFGAGLHTYLVTPEDCLDTLPGMVRAFDEPFGNSSAIGTYFCARLAAQEGVRVLLAGDGGDELFAGNEWYATDMLLAYYHSIPNALRKLIIEPAATHLPYGPMARVRNYIRRANLPAIDRVSSFQFLSTHAPAEVFERDFLESLQGESFLDTARELYASAPARDHLDRLLYVDMKTTIAESDLPKVTCMTEMAGVQTRFPFLDRSVAEFSCRVPVGLKVKRLEKRYLFKRAFRNLLPAEIIHKKKHGFGVPVANWLKSDPKLRELTRETLFSRRATGRGYFRRDFMERLIEQHEADTSSYYGDILWTLLVTELWHRQTVDAMVGVAS